VRTGGAGNGAGMGEGAETGTKNRGGWEMMSVKLEGLGRMAAKEPVQKTVQGYCRGCIR